MGNYESPTIEQAGGPGKVDPQQLVIFSAVAIFVVFAMYALTLDIAVDYDTVYVESRNIM